MADCGSLEALMSSLTNEVAALKVKVATLEGRQNEYATKSELSAAIDGLKSIVLGLIDALRKSFEATLRGINEILATLLGRNSTDLEGRVKNLEIKVSALEFISDTLRRVVEGLKSRLEKLEGIVNSLLSRISGIENIQGQLLMDVKNIYSVLSRLQRSIDDLSNQIKLLAAALLAAVAAAVAAALLGITSAVAALKTAIAAIQGQIVALWAAIRGLSLKPALPGRPGLNGLNGINGRDGINGRNGKDGRDGKNGINGRIGINGRNGVDGVNGIDGVDGKDAEVEFTTISVPVFDGCKEDGSGAKFRTEQLQVIKGLESQTYAEFNEVSKIAAAKCDEKDCYAAVPEWWQIRPEGKRPQLVLQFCKKNNDGSYGSPMYVITVPHVLYTAKISSYPLATYEKGSFEGELKLADNSKVIVNCVSQAEAERVLSVIRRTIKPEMLNGSSIKYSERRGAAIQEGKVYVRMATYFKNGIANASDFTWRAKFNLPR